jgi:hypothetical protein
MKTLLNSFLVKAKICDPDGTLSLSNLTLMVLIVKLATISSLDWVTMSTFMLTLLNHNAKKYFARDKSKKVVSDTARLDKMESETKSLVQALNLKGLGR